MLHGPRKTKTQRSKNTTAYRKVFLEHVHQLIQFGYSRLTPANHVADDEPAITGHLVDSMNDVIDDKKSPRWARFYSVHDDPPVRHQTKTGKRRKRVDIRFDSIESIPRTRFFLEAKRLGKKNPVGDYLGDEGLGCFLSDEYAVSEPDGGMLPEVAELRSAAEIPTDYVTVEQAMQRAISREFVDALSSLGEGTRTIENTQH